jgi:hypothetical protein
MQNLSKNSPLGPIRTVELCGIRAERTSPQNFRPPKVAGTLPRAVRRGGGIFLAIKYKRHPAAFSNAARCRVYGDSLPHSSPPTARRSVPAAFGFWFLTATWAETAKRKMPPEQPLNSSSETLGLAPAAVIYGSACAVRVRKMRAAVGAKKGSNSREKQREKILGILTRWLKKCLRPHRRSAQSSPVWREIAESFEKTDPSLGQSSPKRENSFFGATPHNSRGPAPPDADTHLVSWQTASRLS